ncbi:MAG: carbon-nitrogen hydrolase family protein [Chloroflexota bacterium]
MSTPSAIPREYRKYEKSVIVSVVNYRTIWGDKAANLAKIMQTVTFAAARHGSKIIAFPEMALTGYECREDVRIKNRPCSMHRKAAEPIPGPSTRCLAGLANQLGVYIIFGMPELDEADGGIYNAAAVVGPEGVLGSYRKLHLSPITPWWTERLCFKTGAELPVFATRYGPIGVQICYDFWCFPELTRLLMLKGARIIFNCTAARTGPGLNELMTWGTAYRGAESIVYTASANLVGVDRTQSFCGQSNISGPNPPALVSVHAKGDEGEGIVTATLDFEKLHSYWKRGGPKQHLRVDLVAREYSSLANTLPPRRISRSCSR